MKIEFVGYDGAYPNLCSGELVLRVNGELRNDFRLVSGGSVSFTEDWDDIVTQGRWMVDVPNDLKKYESEIAEIVNENVPHGRCGGCV